jgi:autotransporter-associated beta strand protein
MTPTVTTRSSSLAAIVLPLALCGLSPAATVTYDADTLTSGAQDGAGAGWNTSATNLWNGSGDVTWPNSTVDEAIFGAGTGTAGTVNVGIVNTNRITFNAAGSGTYTLSGGTITLGGTTPTITANVDAKISSILTGGTTLTKAGNGTLTLTGANSFTGPTTINAGTLRLGDGTTNPTVNGNYAIGAATTLRLDYNTGGGAAQTWSKFSGSGTLILNSGKNFDTSWGSIGLGTGFTGTIRIERGRIFSQAATANTYGLGGTTKIAVRTGGHYGMWENGITVPASVAFEIEGTGYGEAGYEGAIRMANNSSTSTINGPVTLTGNATLGAQSTGTGVINGVISGGFNLTTGTSSMSGTVELNAANTHSGLTSVGVGTLRLGHQNALQNSTLSGNAGAVAFKSPLTAFTVGGLEGARNLALANTTSAAIALTVGNNNATTTYSGVLSGAGSVIKTGTGTTRLTGVNTYTGTTTVNGGTLLVSPSATISGACTMANGTTLSVAGSTTQSWRTSSLTAGAPTGATLEFPAMTASTTVPIVATALSTIGTATVKTTAPYVVGTFPLIQYTGTIGGAGFAGFALAALPPGVQGTLVDDSANGKVSLNITAVDQFTWQGAPGTLWDNGTTTSWTLASSPSVYQAGGMVLFDDSATGSTTVSVSGSVAPLNIAVNNTTKNYTFSGNGSITGSTSLAKSGSGTLTVANSNTYTGTTTVSAGVLQIGDGTVDGSLAGPITNNATVTFNSAGASSYGGVLGGGGAGTIINKDGAGTLTLTGTSNTFSGVTSVNTGTLRLGNGVTNASFSAGTYTVPSGCRLLVDYATAVNTAGLASKMSGAGLLELNTAQAVDGTANWGPNSSTATAFGSGFTGTLQVNRGRIDLNSSATGVGNLAKLVIKDGAQFLGWAGTYPATLAIEIAGNGWGEAGQPGALRMAGGQIGTWAGPITLTANAGILSQSTTSSFTLTGSITGPYECNFIRNGPIIVTPTSLVRNSYGSTRIGTSGGTGIVSAGNDRAFSSGPLVMDGGVLALNGFSFDFASLSGTAGEIRNNHATDPVTLTVGATGDTTYAGSMIDGNVGKLSLTKTGSGALRLTGSVGYTGDTTISGGLLQTPATGAIGGICSVGAGSELVVTGVSNTVYHQDQLGLAAGSKLTIRNFHSVQTAAPVEVDTTMTTAGTVTVNVPSGTFVTGLYPLIYYPVGGSIGGAGYSALSLGTLPRGVSATLQNNTGNSSVDLNVTAVNPLKWKGNVNSTWDIGTTQNWTLAGVADNYVEGDTVVFDDTASAFAVTLAGPVAPGSVTFDHSSHDYTLSGAGAITGGTTLTKAGTGKLTLGGGHTYTGTTFVTGGTLELLDGASIAGPITNDATITFNLAGAQSLTTSIGGTGSVTKTGAGTLTISTAQAYAGGTTVSGGTVKLFGANNGSSSAGPGTLTVNAGAIVEANSHNVLGNGTGANLSPLVINGGTYLSDQYTHINSITMTGATLGVRSGISQVDGMDLRTRTVAPTVTTLASATSSVVSSKLTLRNDTTMTVADGAAAKDLEISGAIDGVGALIKEGAGTLTLTGPGATPTSNSALSGNITLNGGKLVGAAVRTGSNTVFGLASNTRTITANAGTTLEFQAPNTFGSHGATAVPSLVVNNATVTNSDPLATNAINNGLANVTLNNGVLTATVGNGTSTINGATRPGEGYGCWGINGTVTSTGTSTISSTASGMAGRILLGSGVDTTMNVVDGTLTVSAPLQAGDAGVLGGLQKTGAGKLVLSAANIYSSPTTVAAGTLELTGSLIAASPGVTTPSNITVASGATLMGTGTAAGTLAANGIVAPGSSIGTLASGSATFGATGSLNVEINSSTLTADKLAITGNLNIDPAAALTVTDLGSGTPPSGKLVIVTYTGTWNGGTFAGRPDDSAITVNGNTYTLNYNDTDAGVNAVTLTVGGVVDPFGAWASGFGLTGGDAAKTADPDQDGVPNFFEFATNSNPTSGSSGPRVYPLVFTIGADKALTYTMAVRKSAVFAPSGSKQTATRDQLVYTVEASDQLATWNTVPVTEVTGATATNIQTALGSKLTTPALGADWEWHTFRTDAGAQVDPSDYIRLQVTTVP